MSKFNTRQISYAFRKLNKKGILSFRNFACCRSCALSELDDYQDGTKYGYCFYTNQGKYDLKNDGEVYLSYGLMDEKVVDERATKTKKIAEEIISTLKEFGISSEWDGKIESNILMICK